MGIVFKSPPLLAALLVSFLLGSAYSIELCNILRIYVYMCVHGYVIYTPHIYIYSGKGVTLSVCVL